MIKIGIVSPITALRAGMRALLDGHPDLKVTWESPVFNGFDPGSPEVEVFVAAGAAFRAEDFAHLRESHPQAAVLFLVSSENEAHAAVRLSSGATWGLLPVESGPEDLAAAIRVLAQGLVVISPLFTHMLNRAQNSRESGDPVEELSAREREVLSLLAEGLANKQIALRLGISEHTAKFHISSILGKLGVLNRTEAVRKGVQQGLIEL